MKEDDRALQSRRINRNTRLREAQEERDRVVGRADGKLTGVLRAQYSPGTPVSWMEKKKIRHGQAIGNESLKFIPYLTVRENVTQKELMVSVEQILAAGDFDPNE